MRSAEAFPPPTWQSCVALRLATAPTRYANGKSKAPAGRRAAELLRILAMASDRYPILENFNVFDRFNIDEKDRPARREAFRENMRDEIRRRLGCSLFLGRGYAFTEHARRAS